MTDRLTKNELTWLLAQEARTAAQTLRRGVGISSGEELPTPTVSILEEGSGGVESTLNRLDEAVSMLASLHGHPVPRGRRGRIDLAALVWEVAPEARVQLEVGEGTVVFGDESELRRMLHVLIGATGDSQTGPATPGVIIKRSGDEIRVGINLGPDTPATFATERGWLARMATRYGGRLELDGSMQTLVIAADVDMQRREVEDLKKELAAAQAQGEAYARELAAVWTRGDAVTAGDPIHDGGDPHHPRSGLTTIPAASPSASSRSSAPPGAPGGSYFPPPRPSRMPSSSSDGLAVLVATVRSLSANMRGILSAVGRDLAPLRERPGDVGEIAASVGRHVTGASDLVADLARLGSCPIGELPRPTDLVDLLRETLKGERGRAQRHDVKVALTGPEALEMVTQVGALTVLLQILLDHAIEASPAGATVTVTIEEKAGELHLLFDDVGPALPPSARGSVLSRDFDAIAHGRSPGLSLIAASTIASHLGLVVDLEESPQKGARVRLVMPRFAG